MVRTKEINNNQDIIDSRDVIARLKELESQREDAAETASDVDFEGEKWSPEGLPNVIVASDDWSEDEENEYQALKRLCDEAEGYAPDWHHGETLIRDSYFEQYAEQLAEDIGAIDPKLSNCWPYTCIDWERAARELQQDYTSIEFGDVTYWVRS